MGHKHCADNRTKLTVSSHVWLDVYSHPHPASEELCQFLCRDLLQPGYSHLNRFQSYTCSSQGKQPRIFQSISSWQPHRRQFCVLTPLTTRVAPAYPRLIVPPQSVFPAPAKAGIPGSLGGMQTLGALAETAESRPLFGACHYSHDCDAPRSL